MPKPLVIGVDVRDLKVAKTGIKTYLEELCREFTKLNNENLQFRFLDTSFPIYTGKNKPLKWFEHFRYQFWKQLMLPVKAWRNKCDIVFCVDNCVPFIHLGYKTVHSIHDAFCFESPEQYGKLWLWLYKNTTIPGAKRSPYVITATSHGKKQIAHYLKLDPDKLIVVPDGPKRVNQKLEDNNSSILKSLAITPGNYLLHAGSMFKRKNLVALVEAFSKLKKIGYPQLKLVLAGSVSTHKTHTDYDLILETINKHGLNNDVINTGYLTDYQLDQLYKSALLYVFPSLNEGFGLPVLEAFENNLPVLVSDNTCLPEVGGNAVLTFNPFDTNDIFCKIKTALDDPTLREEMIIKGQERLKDFTWESTARQIVEVFKRAADN
ncbi:MAG: glycosyltransferase family 1 protein [Sphingobacteriaceae bacterium]|nr:MAG: glycosyltransferase family 1 protein [Sphingobacteriaceae bacterium]